MIFENPVAKDLFELSQAEAEFFGRALNKFNQNVNWSVFETFAFDPKSPIYARRKSYGRLVLDPLYRALQDMWLQLGVNQGEVQDDRLPGEKTFCHAVDKGREREGRGRVARTALR
jgi:hypothetical protein